MSHKESNRISPAFSTSLSVHVHKSATALRDREVASLHRVVVFTVTVTPATARLRASTAQQRSPRIKHLHLQFGESAKCNSQPKQEMRILPLLLVLATPILTFAFGLPDCFEATTTSQAEVVLQTARAYDYFGNVIPLRTPSPSLQPPSYQLAEPEYDSEYDEYSPSVGSPATRPTGALDTLSELEEMDTQTAAYPGLSGAGSPRLSSVVPTNALGGDEDRDTVTEPAALPTIDGDDNRQLWYVETYWSCV